MVVLDTSVAAAWWFADEASPATDALLDRVVASGAIVPTLFFAEAANVLLQAQRRKRLAPGLGDRLLRILAGLPIDVDPGPRVPERALDLARTHRLSVYDAVYLELATRRGLALASLDADLRRASKAAGIAVLP